MRTPLLLLKLAALVWLLSPSTAAAFYNPQAGRWLNRDSIEETGGANVMAFTGNDSLRQWDSLGACACCECAVSVSIHDVRLDDFLGSTGHIFWVRIALEYYPSPVGGEADFKWEEKTNRPTDYNVRGGAKPNQWYDAFKTDPSTMPKAWARRETSPCDPPVGRLVWDYDWPRVNLRNGAKTTHFRIRVVNPPQCYCRESEVRVTAVQVADPKATPQFSFASPDPSPQ
jgi:hypothetical protein